MVATRFERMVRYVRRLRSTTDRDNVGLDLAPDLPEADLRRLGRLVGETIEGRGGEVAARRRARAIGAAFSTLDVTGRRRFFDLLAEHHDDDDEAVDRAMEGVYRATDDQARRRAEAELRRALQPRRERLFRRFAGLDGGLPFLVVLREDLLTHRAADPRLADVDRDLKEVLTRWFDVALLSLVQLTWDSSARLLERLIDYEAVHAIESWDDLKGRLGPGRRCYALLHPAMADDPLIFVEVALTRGIVTELGPVLDHSAERVDATSADTAIFYSISNCHRGLAGVSLGDFLIKSVAEQLTHELPNVRQFATLSPLPGFRRWLEAAIRDGELDLAPGERRRLSADDPELAEHHLAELVAGPVPDSADPRLAAAEPALMRLAADYLVNRRAGARALDPVAHFHLTNGASIERLNWWANPSPAGWERGLGMMVNYRYRLNHIERNYDRYVEGGEITVTDGVRKLLTPVAAASDDR
ncbi:MAG: malonyl-CoA decarboxylase domain-containing protein [Acidimicrobiales bacterium]